MSETKFTPGDWRYENGKVLTNNPIKPTCRVIALMSLAFKGSDEMHANGELLGASKAMYTALAKIRRSDLPDNEQPLWDEIQAALARARGE